jgi:hypothetical protein
MIPYPRYPLPDLRLELRATPPAVVPDRVSTPLLTHRILKVWATPRYGACHTGQILTERRSHDLCTQVSFEKDTPLEVRGSMVNPEWEEWLMGFPLGWTSL